MTDSLRKTQISEEPYLGPYLGPPSGHMCEPAKYSCTMSPKRPHIRYKTKITAWQDLYQVLMAHPWIIKWIIDIRWLLID